jgi:hypothetical protein
VFMKILKSFIKYWRLLIGINKKKMPKGIIHDFLNLFNFDTLNSLATF